MTRRSIGPDASGRVFRRNGVHGGYDMRPVSYAALFATLLLWLPVQAQAERCEEQKLASPDGPGVIVRSDCRRIEGEFRNGLLSGRGKVTHADGQIEEGDFRRGRLWGIGRIAYADGRVAEGDFVDGMMNGQGKLTWPDGRVHEGLFFNGSPGGPGRYRNARGEVWAGMFSGSGNLDGRGMHVLRDGTTIIGEFRVDRPVGDVTIEKPDGTKEAVSYDLRGRKLAREAAPAPAAGAPAAATPAATPPAAAAPAGQAAPQPAPAGSGAGPAAGQVLQEVDRAVRGLRGLFGR